MKVLVTGSSGYIGSHLCKLLHSNHEVHGLDIKHNASVDPYLSKFWNHDITKPFHGEHYDAVVHLAALVRVGESVASPSLYYRTNIGGTDILLSSIDCDNFIFASSATANEPTSPYAYSKCCAEHIVRERMKTHTIFRFYNVIGTEGFLPSNSDSLFYKLIDASKSGSFNLYGDDHNTPDGSTIRDYVHVMEICAAIEIALKSPSTNAIENLGHGIGYSVKEMVDIFKRVNGIKFVVNSYPKRQGDLAVNILKDVSSYMIPTHSIEEMLEYKDHE